MENEKQEKCRIQFDLTKQQIQELDALVVATGSVSRAETMRKAIRLFKIAVSLPPGTKLATVAGDKIVEINLLF